jgi:RNA polymerase sigma factor (sigma-70 family)
MNPGKTKQNVEKVTEMFAIHGDFLFCVLRKELSEDDARDLWQNLFLTLITKPVPSHTTNIRRYLYQAAVHDIIDLKRRAQMHKKKVNEYLDMAPKTQYDRCPVEQLIGIESVREAFKKIKGTLPPTVGQAVLHKFQEQLSRREISEKMNIKKETVDKYLSIGTKMMEKIEGHKK